MYGEIFRSSEDHEWVKYTKLDLVDNVVSLLWQEQRKCTVVFPHEWTIGVKSMTCSKSWKNRRKKFQCLVALKEHREDMYMKLWEGLDGRIYLWKWGPIPHGILISGFGLTLTWTRKSLPRMDRLQNFLEFWKLDGSAVTMNYRMQQFMSITKFGSIVWRKTSNLVFWSKVLFFSSFSEKPVEGKPGSDIFSQWCFRRLINSSLDAVMALHNHK